MVEFALISVTLLMITFGIIDLGRAVMDRSMLTNAIREAARRGSVAPSDNAGMLAAAQQTSPTLGLAAITVNCYFWDDSLGTPTWVVYPGGAGSNCNTVGSNGRVAGPRDRLVVDTTHTFRLAAGRLIPIPNIVMRESAKVSIQ